MLKLETIKDKYYKFEDYDPLRVLDVEYPQEENVTKEEADKDSFQVITRDIQSVPDFVNSILIILSNRFILDAKYMGLEIKSFENLFTRPDGDKYLTEVFNKYNICFRGQSEEYKYVLPSLYRNVKTLKNEKNIVFESKAKSANTLMNLSSFDTLALLQHYGQCTRILDVTTNALIALFFAVSDTEFTEDDGVVFLYNFSSSCFPNDPEVIAKSALSTLTYSEKNELFKTLSIVNIKNENEDIKSYLKQHCLPSQLSYKLVTALDKIYSIVEKETCRKLIRIKDLFGITLVKPYQIDDRITRQSGNFVLFGLEYISDPQNDDYKKIADYMLHKHEILYTPRKCGNGSEARIIIKAKYKKFIKKELAVLGITEEAVYPDISHKNAVIKNKYLI